MTARLYLAVLLLAMATGQGLSFGRFAAALEGYGMVPQALLRPVALGVVAAEAAAGAALLLGADWAHWPGALLALGVAVGWTAVAAVALRRQREVRNCGCFGAYLSQPLRRSVLVQDAAFVGVAAWVIATCPLP
ncbi:MAG: hypothetical protein HYU28_06435 [Actinobacteria bacterium]|nr:hypothetical protein [Actinomycetota bacterium]